jgi:Rrf2 family protein
MRLNITTDYAIRALLCLAENHRPTSGIELSETMKIPQSYLLTVMAKLKKAGIVSSTRGQSGGYELEKLPEEVTLWDIISVMEGSPQFFPCLEEGYECACYEVDKCPIRRVQNKVQKSMEDGFRSVSLADLLREME